MAIGSSSASRSRANAKIGSPIGTRSRWLAARSALRCRNSRVRVLGTLPRRIMSSVNEVMASRRLSRGRVRNVPAPRRRAMTPSTTRSSMARRSVIRATFHRSARSRSAGSVSPSDMVPSNSSSSARVATTLGGSEPCIVHLALAVRDPSCRHVTSGWRVLPEFARNRSRPIVIPAEQEWRDCALSARSTTLDWSTRRPIERGGELGRHRPSTLAA